ncbi:MAG: TonB-dependent receptor, partial [Chloroflexi bacterium]|nr:TonB-dependent receptor [Chloroflexota bacterium]
GIVVKAPTSGATQRTQGRQRVQPVDLGRVLQPAASGDVAAYLQRLPGVVAQGDRGGQLFIRGGTPAENMALVDGIMIYQPFHIVGFFSAFPEELVADADFYAGGYGARYSGRTSSVLDVHMRGGNRSRYEASAGASPFLAEATVEGPLNGGQASWIASASRSLIDPTSSFLAGSRQPLEFESQYLKLTSFGEAGSRCSAMGLRTYDEGRMDAEDRVSRVSWENLVAGGQCIMLFEERMLRLLEVNFGYSVVRNAAVTREASTFHSSISRLSHDAHTTNMIGSVPIQAGYHVYLEMPSFDLAELFANLSASDASIFGANAYFEAGLKPTGRLAVTPGMVVVLAPRARFEPRLRASWQPWGRSTEEITAAAGLYHQDLTGVSDSRDPGSVFIAWTRPRDAQPMEAVHLLLGWQQTLASTLHWSVEGYYKRLRNVPVPAWQAIVQYNTVLAKAKGDVYGVDARVEYDRGPLYGFVGYGYGQIRYETAQDNFEAWFGDPVQSFHPPHDRRHTVNAQASLDIGSFTAPLGWQLGSGLPYTQPIGIDDALAIPYDLEDVRSRLGTTRMLLDRPYQGRLPAIHRLDASLKRSFGLGVGDLDVQLGVINAYDRRNMFYYDIYTGRRIDQLPLVPYLSLRLKPMGAAR